MTTALCVSQACKRFGTTQALDGAELTLERGQLLLLLGPNGAGKTTLIRAVAGRVRVLMEELIPDVGPEFIEQAARTARERVPKHVENRILRSGPSLK